MASFFTYRCEECGYQLSTAPSGRYALFSGEHRTCLCPSCREIVSINLTALHGAEMAARCPECGGAGLRPWNPITGCCPKCGGHMKRVDKAPVLAD